MQYKVIKKQTIPGEAPEGTGVRDGAALAASAMKLMQQVEVRAKTRVSSWLNANKFKSR